MLESWVAPSGSFAELSRNLPGAIPQPQLSLIPLLCPAWSLATASPHAPWQGTWQPFDNDSVWRGPWQWRDHSQEMKEMVMVPPFIPPWLMPANVHDPGNPSAAWGTAISHGVPGSFLGTDFPTWFVSSIDCVRSRPSFLQLLLRSSLPLSRWQSVFHCSISWQPTALPRSLPTWLWLRRRQAVSD